MKAANVKYLAMIFAAAIAASTATTAYADVNVDNISDMTAVYNIDEIPDMNVINLDAIPDITVSDDVNASAPALTFTTKSYDRTFEADINDIPDFKNVIVLSNIPELDAMTEIKVEPVKALTTLTAAETKDEPDTGDVPETSDTPDFAETDSPLENLPEEYKQKFYGDVDFDGVITSADALLALRMGLNSGSAPIAREVSDVDGDGAVTSSDALEILRNAVGVTKTIAKNDAVEGVKWLKDSNGDIYGVIAGGWNAAGIINISGYVCGFDESSKLLSGEAVINGVKYVFTENGVLLNGWIKTDDGMKLYKNGVPCDGIVTVYDQTFYFVDNIPTVGWTALDGKHVYFDENGAAAKGFVDIDGKTYYFDNELDNKTGFIEVAGKHYMMYEDGGYATGWTEIDGETYYFDNKGAAVKGWNEIGGTQYYFIAETQLAKGEYMIGTTVYFFEDDGRFETGFISTDNGTIYKNAYGFKQDGFLTIDGSIYYFNDDGIMAVGETTINGSTYIFDENGVMTTGWTRVSGFKAYMKDGEIVKGAATIDGANYFFEDDGTLQTGLFSKGGALYYKNVNGVYQKGFITVGSDTYYFDSDYKAVTDFQTIDGKLYCFGDDYKMLKNTKVGLYRITEDGVCIKLTTVDGSTVKYKADDIIEQIGKNANTLCHYVYNHMSYYFVNEPMVYSDPYNANWGNIAAYGMNRGYGACYHYSSFLHALLQRAGYTCRIIVGTGYYTSLHSFNQVYINGQWLTYDALYDTCGASTGYMQSLGYTYNHFINYTF